MRDRYLGLRKLRVAYWYTVKILEDRTRLPDVGHAREKRPRTDL